METSVKDLQKGYPKLNIISGKKLNRASKADIENWVKELK